MKERYFHLYADGSTIREIDLATYRDYIDYYASRPRKVAVVFESGVSIYQRAHTFQFIPKKQFLKLAKEVVR